ncbi:MAG: hypothetical protein N3D75_03920 [Candidatus Aenigmarchaeota archaeon]|nr:hypothetical protein [Candidatus Aenigmarchaeota archaeon]
MPEAHVFIAKNYEKPEGEYKIRNNISGIELYSDENIDIFFSGKGHEFNTRKIMQDFEIPLLIPFYREQERIFQMLLQEDLLILYSNDVLAPTVAEKMILEKIGVKQLKYAGTYFTQSGNIINLQRKA